MTLCFDWTRRQSKGQCPATTAYDNPVHDWSIVSASRKITMSSEQEAIISEIRRMYFACGGQPSTQSPSYPGRRISYEPLVAFPIVASRSTVPVESNWFTYVLMDDEQPDSME